jgi:hypothetical protein
MKNVKSLRKNDLRPFGVAMTVGNGRIVSLSDKEADLAVATGRFELVESKGDRSSKPKE